MHTHLVDEWLRRDWFVRDANTRGDLDVIDEVITRDMYDMRAYAKWFPAPSLVLDVGAHIGTFSVLVKTLWPEVPVVAFEPNPESFELLKANVGGFSNVQCINAAVSYGERPDLVYVSSLRSTGSGFVIERDKAEDAMRWKDAADHVGYSISDIPIQCVEIDSFVPDAVPTGILMKLDAELAEINLLNGMSDTLARKIHYITGEYHCEGGWKEFMERVDVSRYPQLEFEVTSAESATQPIGLFRAILRTDQV